MEPSEEKSNSPKTAEPMINAYKSLPTRAKAELRRLSDYQDVRILAGEAFWKVWGAVDKAYPQDVVSAMLILFRDRGANTELAESQKALGKIFVGGDENPVKLGRFKRLLAVDNFDAGFKALRPILRLFRHDRLNWNEVAEFLNALYWHEIKVFDREDRQLYFVKKRLADAYFEPIFSQS